MSRRLQSPADDEEVICVGLLTKCPERVNWCSARYLRGGMVGCRGGLLVITGRTCVRRKATALGTIIPSVTA